MAVAKASAEIARNAAAVRTGQTRCGRASGFSKARARAISSASRAELVVDMAPTSDLPQSRARRGLGLGGGTQENAGKQRYRSKNQGRE